MAPLVRAITEPGHGRHKFTDTWSVPTMILPSQIGWRFREYNRILAVDTDLPALLGHPLECPHRAAFLSDDRDGFPLGGEACLGKVRIRPDDRLGQIRVQQGVWLGARDKLEPQCHYQRSLRACGCCLC